MKLRAGKFSKDASTRRLLQSLSLKNDTSAVVLPSKYPKHDPASQTLVSIVYSDWKEVSLTGHSHHLLLNLFNWKG